MDLISDQFPHVSTYNYAENSPIANIDLWGLQAFSIHGTNSSSATFEENPETLPVLLELSRNETINNEFNWPSGTNGFTNDQGDRTEAAGALAGHVLGNLADAEDITLIGHSHGGNVAIQAVNMIQEGLDEAGDDRSINLITIATPAFNGANDPENPANTSLSSHTQFFSSSDMVQTVLANTVGVKLPSRIDTNTKVASRTFDNPITQNVRVNGRGTGATRNSIKAHSIHKTPNLLRRN